MRDILISLGISTAIILILIAFCYGFGQVIGHYVEPYGCIAIASLYFAISASLETARNRRRIINLRNALRKQRNDQANRKFPCK